MSGVFHPRIIVTASPAVPCVCLQTPDDVEVNNKSMVLAAQSDSAPSDSSRCSFRIFKRVVISPALLLVSLAVVWVQFCRRLAVFFPHRSTLTPAARRCSTMRCGSLEARSRQ
jgi:hypothetical protein